jgi:hypothetical protein
MDLGGNKWKEVIWVVVHLKEGPVVLIN